MPTPLAHGLAGIAAARTVRRDWSAWHFAALAFAITLVPDLDFVPGVLLGEAGLFHRTGTHTFAGAIVLSAAIAALLTAAVPVRDAQRWAGPGSRFLRWYGFVLPVYMTHLLLDVFSPNVVNNSGLPLLWPFSSHLFNAPMAVPGWAAGFFNLDFGPDAHGFFRTLFSPHALAVYVAEALIFSPVLLVPFVARRLARRRQAADVMARLADPEPASMSTRPATSRRSAQHPAPADLAG